MSLADAKILLNDVLDKQVGDSLINVYIAREKINSSTISLQKTEMLKLLSKNINLSMIMVDNNTIIIDKDKEIADLNNTIKEQKKVILKERVLKTIGFAAAIIGPILIIISMH